MRQCQGFVLIITLVFLNVLAALACFALLDANSVLKSRRHEWQSAGVRLQMQEFLQKIEQSLLSGTASCLVPIIATDEIAKQPISWWQKYGCSVSVDKIHYLYVVEDLGQDACGQIISNNNHGLIAQYYRISLMALPVYIQPAKLIIQSTLAKAVPSDQACPEQTHLVYNGRQMWHEL